MIFGEKIEMRKNALFAFGVTVALSVTGCGEVSESDATTVVEKSSTLEMSAEMKQAYVDGKKIPANAEQRRQRALDDFIQRVELADYLLSNELASNPAIQVKVAEIKTNTVIKEYFDRFLEKKVNDEALQTYYEENKHLYAVNKYRLAQILLKDRRNSTEAELDAIVQEVQGKYEQGISFQELVTTYSDDMATKDKSGELGWVDSETGDQAFVQAVQSLAVGGLSAPLKTERGTVLLMLLEMSSEEVKPFADVKSEIRYQFTEQARKAELKRLIENLSV